MTIMRHHHTNAAREAASLCGCEVGRNALDRIKPDAPRLNVIETSTEAALDCTQCSPQCPALPHLVQLINQCVMESRRPLGLHRPPPTMVKPEEETPIEAIAS